MVSFGGKLTHLIAGCILSPTDGSAVSVAPVHQTPHFVQNNDRKKNSASIADQPSNREKSILSTGLYNIEADIEPSDWAVGQG